MKALILAAGDGTRFKLKEKQQNKLLSKLYGLSLIERSILTAYSCGIKDFIIVGGYQKEKIENHLLPLTKKGKIKIKFLINKDWEKENGRSVLVAENYFKKPFLLLMGDHVVDPEVIAGLLSQRLPQKKSVILCIDSNLNSVYNLHEATKVFIKKGKIFKIGKRIRKFNAVDIGIFLCSPFIFEVLKKEIKKGKDKISEAMQVQAKRRKLYSYNIQGRFWIDIDTVEDLLTAQETIKKTGKKFIRLEKNELLS